MKRGQMSGWGIFWTVVLTVAAIVGIFCLTTYILALNHHVTFVEEILSWGKAAQEVIATSNIARC